MSAGYSGGRYLSPRGIIQGTFLYYCGTDSNFSTIPLTDKENLGRALSHLAKEIILEILKLDIRIKPSTLYRSLIEKVIEESLDIFFVTL